LDRKKYIEGLIFGSLAYCLWGLLPLYWKLVSAISPYQLFAQRVVWSFLFIMILLIFKKNHKVFFKIVTNFDQLKKILPPTVFISINWMLYIWAVNNNFIIETSLGYYITPLILTVLGRLFYKERLNNYQKIGIGLATLGVVFKTVLYGKLPLISLVLALSFAMYGFYKKKSGLDSLTGLGFETMIIGIPSLIYLLFVESSGQGITGNLPISYWIMISFSGLITATPLLLYAESTKRLPLNVVGFLQYLSPTIALFLAIFVYKETFDMRSFFSFALIWIGLGFFSYSQYDILKQSKLKVIGACDGNVK